jgi:NADH-quinone oxidoreductase subunit C
MHGMLRLQEKIRRQQQGETFIPEANPDLMKVTQPSVPRLQESVRRPEQTDEQLRASSNPTGDEATAALVVEEAPSTQVAPLTAADFAGLLAELGITELPKDGPPIIPVDAHLELARRLKALGYKQLVTIAATHWLAGKGRKGTDAAEPEHFEIVYAVRTVGPGTRVASWALKVLPGQPVLTMTGIYAGADWQEREQFDLLGVTFAGHPDLRRLMMTENEVGHPLRRDYASDTHAPPWR